MRSPALELALLMVTSVAKGQQGSPATAPVVEDAVVERFDTAYRYEDDGSGYLSQTMRVRILTAAGQAAFSQVYLSTITPTALTHCGIPRQAIDSLRNPRKSPLETRAFAPGPQREDADTQLAKDDRVDHEVLFVGPEPLDNLGLRRRLGRLAQHVRIGEVPPPSSYRYQVSPSYLLDLGPLASSLARSSSSSRRCS